jgi:hypothetical protein
VVSGGPLCPIGGGRGIADSPIDAGRSLGIPWQPLHELFCEASDDVHCSPFSRPRRRWALVRSADDRSKLVFANDRANDGKVGETLPCGPPTASERLRRRRTFCWFDKELRDWDGQCLGETIQNVDGRVFLSPLKTTNVGSIYTGIKGQPLLREAASHSDSPQIPSHQRAPFHASRRALCRLLNHWPYPVNYDELSVQFGHKSSRS